jgi:hypothetical protein
LRLQFGFAFECIQSPPFSIQICGGIVECFLGLPFVGVTHHTIVHYLSNGTIKTSQPVPSLTGLKVGLARVKNWCRVRMLMQRAGAEIVIEVQKVERRTVELEAQ